jgi:hypothetical protein
MIQDQRSAGIRGWEDSSTDGDSPESAHYKAGMSVPDCASKTRSVEERLALIDRLWLSIAKDAQQGDSEAQKYR